MVNNTVFERIQKQITNFKLSKLIIYIVLSVWASTTILPLLWIFNNSFKASNEIINKPFAIAGKFNPVNYLNALTKVDMGRSYMNSFIMSGSVVVLVMLFGGMAAYAISRFEFRGRTIIQGALAIGLLIPGFVTVVPVYEILIKLHLVDTYFALIFPQTAGNLVFATLVLSAYMASLPKELEEAAILDGCNRWQIFSKIIVPMSKPAFATVGIFSFLWSYNDLFSSLVFVSSKKVRPICVLLNEVSSQYGTDYGLQATAVVLTVVPVLIVYLILQRQIVSGLTAGAVKG
ncbi:carbohydrate ABC transporter permease [Haliovirga abyssi]|uniref:Sugar ABC transporter permease n=1 Tax=Haliovirga abyssi TaxID=2996794 RepID=A0AAU9D6P8_9FUSO|nr:carbohydrate ABC transporter permease [Haliovirga abyssi]BDU51649.1 sugar ABC transporter permease [Haliovirga abyssi]